MAYAVAADLDTNWGASAVTLMALGDDGETRNTALVDAACLSASAEVDGYLARRYALPLQLGPEGRAVLCGLAVDLAVWRLASRSPLTMTETIGKRRDSAIAFLDKVAMEKAAIPLLGQDAAGVNATGAGAGGGTGPSAAPADPDASPYASDLRADPRVFTRDRLRYF